MEKFTIGLAVGALLGMAIIANSQKTRKLFIKSQDEIKTKFDDMLDDKIEMLDELDEDDDDEPVRTRKYKKTKRAK